MSAGGRPPRAFAGHPSVGPSGPVVGAPDPPPRTTAVAGYRSLQRGSGAVKGFSGNILNIFTAPCKPLSHKMLSGSNIGQPRPPRKSVWDMASQTPTQPAHKVIRSRWKTRNASTVAQGVIKKVRGGRREGAGSECRTYVEWDSPANGRFAQSTYSKPNSVDHLSRVSRLPLTNGSSGQK